jgi:hypothetical protein
VGAGLFNLFTSFKNGARSELIWTYTKSGLAIPVIRVWCVARLILVKSENYSWRRPTFILIIKGVSKPDLGSIDYIGGGGAS